MVACKTSHFRGSWLPAHEQQQLAHSIVCCRIMVAVTEKVTQPFNPRGGSSSTHILLQQNSTTTMEGSDRSSLPKRVAAKHLIAK